MAVRRVKIYWLEIEDKPGSLVGLLEKAAVGNMDFECFTAFSSGHGRGRVYFCAKDPAALEACAAGVGIEPNVAAGFIVSGPDAVGCAGADIKGLATAGINGVLCSAMVSGADYKMLVVVAAEDGDAAAKVLGS